MTETEASVCALDVAIAASLADLGARGVPKPEVLVFLGTGVGMLPASLKTGARVPLGKVAGMPAIWNDVMLHSGQLGALSVWLVEDAPGPPDQGLSEAPGEAPWQRGYPCWLAAAAGASVCVHTSAGHSLADANGRLVRPGALALVSDHVNLSGRTPLLGLGGSKLGPLFPDLSRLHHAELRKAALRRGKKLGVPVGEAIAACTSAPSLETPAERRFWSRAGAEVAVQGLATPLHACAHAGLSVLALVAVTDAGEGLQDVGQIVEQADQLAPAIEELVTALTPDLKKAARALSLEE
jgi:purine-nucleoside phosphorylase